MLSICNLSVSVDAKAIIQDLSFQVQAGEIHVLMGPNGSGKSSLVYTLMGHPSYEVKAGSLCFLKQNLSDMPTHKRALAGMYLSMQQPQDIAGLQVLSFLKELYSLHSEKQVTLEEFLEIVKPLFVVVGLAENMLYRNINDGFSGGEKKRFELLQMFLLKPKLALLDEIDSGVDIDGLHLIAKALKLYKEQNPESSLVIVTHYRRLLEFIQPDIVHVMIKGRIVHTGDHTILHQIEQKGYDQYAKGLE